MVKSALTVVSYLTLSVLSLGQTWAAGPWPQWQGPQRNAVSSETGLLQDLPEGGPPRVWLYEDCGLGYGGPAIVDDRLYILGDRGGMDYLLCLNANTGDEHWAVPLGESLENNWGDGPRSTPTVDGDFIYALAPAGELYCLRSANGEVVWTRSMQEFGGQTPKWGYSESPLVVGDRLFCTPGEKQGAIVALEKLTGELIWQTKDLPDIAHYSSIVAGEFRGRTILVQLLYKELVGVDSSDGTTLWSVPWPGSVAVIPTPILVGDQAYCTAGYGAGCMLVKFGIGDNNVEPIYQNKNMSNHHGGVILHDGHIFGYSDGKGWMCQHFQSGEIVWREKSALGKGSIGYADGRFYCLSEDEGELVMIAASTGGWEEHGRFVLTPQTEQRKPSGKIWTHPVIAGGKLYLRDQELLFCFDVQAK